VTERSSQRAIAPGLERSPWGAERGGCRPDAACIECGRRLRGQPVRSGRGASGQDRIGRHPHVAVVSPEAGVSRLAVRRAPLGRRVPRGRHLRELLALTERNAGYASKDSLPGAASGKGFGDPNPLSTSSPSSQVPGLQPRSLGSTQRPSDTSPDGSDVSRSARTAGRVRAGSPSFPTHAHPRRSTRRPSRTDRSL
jgi:hypothetical protein